MALPREGTVAAKAISGEFGGNDKGYQEARVVFEILGGPDVGRLMTYNGQSDAKSGPYTRADMLAVGWKGKDVTTFAADLKQWIAATGGETTIEIVHIEPREGGKQFRPFAKIQGIGRGSKPLSALTAKDVAEANAVLADEDLPF